MGRPRLTWEQASTRDTRNARRRETEHEVEALGDPDKVGVYTPDDPGVWKWKTPRVVRPGKRPLLNVSRGWGGLTERQQRRGKARTARSWGRMIAIMEQTGQTMEEFVASLSPEELVRGRLKDRNGKFTGAPPTWVPREFHRACIRELMRRGKELWQSNYLDAIQAMTEVATGKVKGASVRDRLTAAQFVIERMEGKQPEVLVLTEDAPWKMAIDDIVAMVPDEQIAAARAARNQLIPQLEEEAIIEAEIVEDEPASPPPRRRAAAPRRKR